MQEKKKASLVLGSLSWFAFASGEFDFGDYWSSLS